jgi:hypothetical protein
MKRLTFGQAQSLEEKAAMVKKKGYDSGKASTGSSGPTSWKAKPDVGKKKLGVVLKKKM